jgi:ribA/ribD-fused uncharacterized protein
MIGPFIGDYRFLSNFYVSPFIAHGHTFPTVEHYYQAAKSSNEEGFRLVLMCRTPAEAKRTGQKVALAEGFEANKKMVMLNGVMMKFNQDPELRRMLVATGNEHLEEVNNWGDTYWGTVGGIGGNWLGRILMMIRDVMM